MLGDGVAHATRPGLLPGAPRCGLVVDLATLTGAQLVATGKRHAAVMAPSERTERRAVAAGLHSGDLVFPVGFPSPRLALRNSSLPAAAFPWLLAPV